MLYRIFKQTEIDEMDRGDIVKELLRINECKDSDLNENTDNLRERFKFFNTNCNLQIWHDGSSISNHSHLLMAVNTLYDIAIHMTDQEF